MKKLLFLFLLFPFSCLAEKSLDEKINDAVAPAANFISAIIFYTVPVSDTIKIPLILVWLLAAGIFFTVYMGFINITLFKHAINITRGAYDKPREKGEVTHFQALSAALSGTVGLGNIAGVAIAIAAGGPGATFWMIVAGFIGMSSKFTECTLGVKYRNIDLKGVVSGGPMYYLSKAFEQRGMKGIGRFLAIFFALMCIGGSIGGGNMFQSNQAVQQIIHISGSSFLANNAWLLGIITALLVGIVILGGVKSIGRVAEFLVPIMCGIYMIAGIVILAIHYTEIPSCITLIVKEAFTGTAIQGGVVGVLIQGFRRASFSNEAGIGSSPIVHSAVKTDEPVSEGIVALLEPFIDTVVICTMTALVITITGFYNSPETNGVELTSQAFGSVLSWFPCVLAACVFLFAYSTMISWSYYGLKSWTYLFGQSLTSEVSFKLIFCLAVVAGASMNLSSVIDFSDAMIFAMSIPNIIGIYVLAPEVKRDLMVYKMKIKNLKMSRLTRK